MERVVVEDPLSRGGHTHTHFHLERAGTSEGAEAFDPITKKSAPFLGSGCLCCLEVPLASESTVGALDLQTAVLGAQSAQG